MADQRRAFRAGAVSAGPGKTAEAATADVAARFSGPVVLLADISEFQADIDDAKYLKWSKAIVIRAAYGTSHQDRSWFGGQRRQLLHDGGARFLGIYHYLVSGQDGAKQADVLHSQIGAIQPGEVIIADFEEGQKAMLSAWYGRMLAHGYPNAQLWAYTGEFFGEENGVLPVEWIAAYRATEPTSPHKLWQFTPTFMVPGVGLADCSVFRGTMDQLAALAYQGGPPPVAATGFSAPRNLAVRAGDSTVSITGIDPPSRKPGPVDHYRVWAYKGSFPSVSTLMPTYPRFMKAAPATFGALGAVPGGTHMTARVVAYTAAGEASAYADAHFEM
jgi:hypothetical protein